MIAYDFVPDFENVHITSVGTKVIFAIGKVRKTKRSKPYTGFYVGITDKDGVEIVNLVMTKLTYGTFMELQKLTFEQAFSAGYEFLELRAKS